MELDPGRAAVAPSVIAPSFLPHTAVTAMDSATREKVAAPEIGTTPDDRDVEKGPTRQGGCVASEAELV